MDVFDKMINNLNAFDEGNYFQDFISANDEFITSQNKKRLYGFGTYTDGEKIVTYLAAKQRLGYNYAINTIKGTSQYQGKVQKGQPYDRVTLNDTGKFYDTFAVDAKKNSFAVTGQDEKEEGNISDNVDIEMALGLYDLQPLIDLLTVDYRKELLSVIRK